MTVTRIEDLGCSEFHSGAHCGFACGVTNILLMIFGGFSCSRLVLVVAQMKQDVQGRHLVVAGVGTIRSNMCRVDILVVAGVGTIRNKIVRGAILVVAGVGTVLVAK